MAATFSDLPVGAAFYTEIMWAVDRGMISGRADGRFAPVEPVDRAAVAVALFRLAGSARYTAPTRAYFKDVPASHPFYRQISWMVDAGVTTGWGDGTYRPADVVTRDAMAAFLYRAAGSPGYMAPGVSPFTDIAPSRLYYKEMCWMAAMGISTGWGDGTIRPLEPVQRDAMCAFLYRYSKNVATAA